MARLSPLLSTREFPVAELAALRLDGEGYPVDECVAPLDEVPSAHQRALALTGHLPARSIAELDTAAWVWGALPDPPPVHTVCLDIEARARIAPSHRLRVREVVLDTADVCRVGLLALTSPLRTAVDLARIRTCWDRSDHEMLRALMSIGRFDAEEFAAMLTRRRNLPRKREALQRLALVGSADGTAGRSALTDPVDVVHGIDAAHRVENPVEVRRVAHLEHEAAERQSIA
ncbi:hypothetical protein G3T37_02525 [Galbitalea soli]|uniref:AbiEi antitoxin C-terminal domain-containing protein n=1 Tax=Galbitalea soli TaxID=1268042 RepID=A0A7C9PLH6_9MICO|nr:hypothetical protein [Galbitalea soli]NYJ30938.1 hypothetical protein [Galbitalea soli]